MKLQQVTDFALKQLDNAGYYLSRYGISHDVNRHNLIAIAVTEKQHLMAELSRLEMKTKIRKHQLEQLRDDVSLQADEWLAKAPKAIASPLLKAKSRFAF
ncbi:hypothetical protein FT643_05890 [Ketobacter sp. MCCC 1A13808]|uniref:hypothetical protein n=1 Tax=Ketobacter sp. MCCC 1A13808 TaxID=2602738 RepID=UPI000F1ED8C6|nr:hypothetical protein [Ketobacter sp. MCCC 1A13808]MVF11672.1 hypothetical protein [Ketobacter sp. MCCC 1A13808]RLP55286.1 MAG: hypothetical protein D6160_05920 [Ketobacter sp.]